MHRAPANVDPYDMNYTDYWYNDRLNVLTGGSGTGINLAQLTYPSNTVSNGDGGGGSGTNSSYGRAHLNLSGANADTFGDYTWQSSTVKSNPPSQAIIGYPSVGWAGRHLEGSNYLFCDGHVKWLKGEKSFAGKTVEGFCIAKGLGTDTPNGSTFTLAPY